VLAGKYRLDRLLGAGGMGAVVAAWHLNFDEAVAVKLLLSQVGATKNALARFEREARAAFRIKSEHAARVMDIGFLDSGSPYIVMELLHGHDLGKELDTRGALPIGDAVDYVLQACEAIAEAHTRGIVHRDLKPDNLFLTQGADGRPCIKVVDFGISKETSAEPEPGQPQGRQSRALTVAGSALGTPLYMSPEQWGSAQTVGPATDIWSLGGILFELLSAKHPFAANDLPGLFAAVVGAPPASLRSLVPNAPEALEVAILRCLEKDPAARFRSISDLARAIAPFGSSRAQHSLERILGVQRAAEGSDVSTAGQSGAVAGGRSATQPTPQPEHSSAAAGVGTSPSVPALTVLGAPSAAVATGNGALPTAGAASSAAGGMVAGAGGQATQQAWQQTRSPQQPAARSKAPVVVGVMAALAAGAVAAGLLVLRSSDKASDGSVAQASSAASVATTAAPAGVSVSPSTSALVEVPPAASAGGRDPSALAAGTGSPGADGSPSSKPMGTASPTLAPTSAKHAPATASLNPPTATATATAKAGKGLFTDM
jgi:serine/threonine protein kinase